MYVMPCACGLVWYTTRSKALPGEQCMQVSKFAGKRDGCGRKLPAPVLERREA